MGNHLKKKFLRPLGRRRFIGSAITSLLGALSIFKGGLVTSSELKKSKSSEQVLDFKLPGKLGNPDMSMLDDPRLDPRIKNAYMANPVPPMPPPVELTVNPSYEDSVLMAHYMDDMLKM